MGLLYLYKLEEEKKKMTEREDRVCVGGVSMKVEEAEKKNKKNTTRNLHIFVG
jgi:hypothetical protein